VRAAPLGGNHRSTSSTSRPSVHYTCINRPIPALMCIGDMAVTTAIGLRQGAGSTPAPDTWTRTTGAASAASYTNDASTAPLGSRRPVRSSPPATARRRVPVRSRRRSRGRADDCVPARLVIRTFGRVSTTTVAPWDGNGQQLRPGSRCSASLACRGSSQGCPSVHRAARTSSSRAHSEPRPCKVVDEGR
jgi:hypothetical protein